MIKTIVGKSRFLTKVCLPIYQLVKYGATGPLYKWPMKSLLKMDLKQYKEGHGSTFDYEHPVLFTEKIQHYKYKFNHPDLNRITDKVSFKDYISEKLGDGYIIPMYGAWCDLQSLENEWFNGGGYQKNLS